MDSSRKNAVIVGVLFIIGTAAGVLSVLVYGSVLNQPDYLIRVSTNPNQIIIGALCVVVMGFALAMVPVLMYPISKKYNQFLALGYVVFRGALETATYAAMVVSRLMLILLSLEFVKAGAPQSSYFQTLGALLLGAHDSINMILVMVFGIGALMLYALFYQSRLIPRWLSIWGLVAIILHLAWGMLAIFQVINPSLLNTADVLNIPIFLQEMVMAVWLIVKGFNLSQSVSLPAKTVAIEP